MSSPELVEINRSIKIARKRGFRIVRKITYDGMAKMCCPIGALWAFGKAGSDKEYYVGFVAGWDGSPPKRNTESYIRGFKDGRSFTVGIS